MKKTILLTGASGFVGRHIYKHLLKLNLNIVVVSREQSLQKIPELSSNTKVFLSENLFQENLDWWEVVMQGVDIVIHSAWYAEPGIYLKSEKNLECLMGTLNIAKIAYKLDIKKFIGIGSCFEYDLTGSSALSSHSPLNPNTLYASTKVSAFYTLNSLFAQKQISFVWCRLFYLFGEGEDERRLFPYLHKKMANGEIAELTSGNQVRDYMDVADAGTSIAELSLGEKSGAINVCSGRGQTIKAIAINIAAQYGRQDLLKFGAREDNITDPPIIIGIPN
jgi:dTDP-6-deoxy-L-talose 4-dehydrogenase (NAD+)